MHDAAPESGLARADLCRFLAACYYEPGPEFAEERLFDSMVAVASIVDSTLGPAVQRMRDAFHADALDHLLVDYTRLFLGPGEILAKPYGSSWLSGEKTLMQDSTMAILALYREGGFDMDEEFRELPDHIAVELEFLYLLTYRKTEAQHSADAPGVGRYEELRRRLLTEHLGRWVTPFTAAVERNAGTAFYRQLAQVTHLFVNAEATVA